LGSVFTAQLIAQKPRPAVRAHELP
jgi:hypothetical protein